MTDSSPHTHTHAQTCPLTSEASKIEERPCGDLLQLLTPHFLAVIQKKKFLTSGGFGGGKKVRMQLT